ncbi:FGGY family carbohydrate kinase [Ferroplasma sp.]|uniref:xylulokinase n=1 Tax=Ferroplasma sp. TaxID=2591003 RepID=UPI00262F2400|nr:FGGY family carbohydrate kinase [Ferroplasma sp.]
MNYLEVDVGTTSMKCTAVNDNGILFTKSISYPVKYGNFGMAEQNPWDWYYSFKKIFQEIEFPIDGIGITGQMHSLLVANGRHPLMDSMLWSDTQSAGLADYLVKKFGISELVRETGNYPLSNFTLLRLLWIRKYLPEIYRKIDMAFVAKDWLKYMLTGFHGTDVSDASGTYLFNVRERKWSSMMFKYLKIGENLFGHSNESMEIQDEYKGIPVIAGAEDQEAAAFVAGIGSNECAMSLGISGVVFSIIPEYRLPKNRSIHLFCHAEANKWHWMGVTQSATSSLDWFMRTFHIDYGRLRNISGDTNIIFMPYLNGERAPIMKPDSRSMFYGISSNTSRDEIILSIMEGVAFSLKHVYDSMGLKKNRIILTGGGTKIKIWNQIIADVFNMEIDIPEDSGSSLGAAMLASSGKLRVYSEPEKYFPVNHSSYIEKYEKYKKIAKSYGNCSNLPPPPVLAGQSHLLFRLLCIQVIYH